jgi:sugar transferase EpsL
MKCKVLIDFFLGSFLFLIFLPIIFVISILNIIFLGLPIFFIQKRIGYRERPFKIIKFRTMKQTKSEDGSLLHDQYRLTKYGSFLRKYSLDELPTLMNVVIGDMSLVGPRPLLPEYLPFYSGEQKLRHNVKPGITGWSQCNGRNAIDWEQRLAMDVWYVRNQTLSLDFKILCKTLVKVLKTDGITYGNHVTMPRFDEQKKGCENKDE